MKKLFILFTFILSCSFVFSQSKVCDLETSKYNDIKTVDVNDIYCLAKNSDKKQTVIHTFAIWCRPCVENFPNAYHLSKEYDIDFYVLLVDKEDGKHTMRAFQYLKNKYPNLNVLVLKEKDYPSGVKKRNRKFVSEITPSKFEDIDDFNKYVVLNQKAEVLMVTTYKDLYEGEEETDEGILNRLVKPLLTKK